MTAATTSQASGENKGAETPQGLVHVSDEMPGISRHRQRGAFRYKAPDGAPIRDEPTLARIRKLAIPPAYEKVWICPLPNGHIQATGRDARGRKQYRYHPSWREQRDADKFEHLLEFGKALPRIRAKVKRVLDRPGSGAPTLELVLATLVRLLDTTMIRVGNDEYARENHSYGLTTLRNRHVELRGDHLSLSFKGKSGVRHELSLKDPRVARVVRRCKSMPGQELFQYFGEDGSRRAVGSTEVNEYLRQLAGVPCSAKDFRTWHASSHALALMREACHGDASSFRSTQILGLVAKRLGNTLAVCRKSYVHPQVLALAEAIESDAATEFQEEARAEARLAGLSLDERRFLAFLQDESRPLSEKLRASLAKGSGKRRR